MNPMFLNTEKAVEYLRFKADQLGVPAENINVGAPGKVPGETPFILVFGKPYDSNDTLSEAAARTPFLMELTVFACVSDPDLYVAAEKASEITQKCLKILRDKFHNIKKVEFGEDALYSSNSVYYVQMILSYSI